VRHVIRGRLSAAFAASAAIVALLLGLSLPGNAKAGAAIAWSVDGHGNAYDPDAIFSLYGWSHSKKAIALGADGTVYVTGATKPEGDQALTIKYNKDTGGAEWRVFARGASNVFGDGAAITIDGSNNVFVAGSIYYNEPSFGVGFLTLKYDQTGTEVWRVVAVAEAYATAEALAMDAAGNVYVAGRVYRPVGSPGVDYLTVKYDPNGVEQWRATVSDAVGSDTPLSLGVDSSGNVYLAATTDATGRNGYLAVSYDPGGLERWRAAPKASSVSDDAFFQAAFDANGNVYLTGTSVDVSTTRAFTIAYDRNGAEKWRSLGQASREASYGIAIDAAANV